LSLVFLTQPSLPFSALLSPRRAIGMTQISLLSTWRWAVQSCLDRNPHPFSIRSSQGRIGSNRACCQGETQLLSLVINTDKHAMVRCSNKAFRSLKKAQILQGKMLWSFILPHLSPQLKQSLLCDSVPHPCLVTLVLHNHHMHEQLMF